MSGRRWELQDGYSIREMGLDFDPIWRAHAKKYFDGETQVFNVGTILSDEEKKRIRELREAYSPSFELRLGVFHHEELIGWHYGRQDPFHTYYMQNSAIFPEHRRRGLYSALVVRVIELATKAGFLTITSRHRATNNDVIIPKLKAGFFIGGLEVDDAYGTLVCLKYVSHPVRKKIFDYRVGHLRADLEIRSLIGVEPE